MRLNLSILNNEMPEWGLRINRPDEPYKLKIAYPVLLTEVPETLNEDVLYIAEAGMLPEKLPKAEGGRPSLLCVGRPAKKWLDSDLEIAYTEKDVSIMSVMNGISRTFAKYGQWEQKLQWILDENRPLREMAEVTSASLGIRNPIWAIGASFRYIFSYVPELAPFDPQMKQLLEENPPQTGEAMTAEEIQELLADPEYHKTKNIDVPTVYPGDNEGYRTLFYNIVVNDVHLARIGFQEISDPIVEKDFAVIQVLGQYVKKALISRGTNAFDRPVEMDQTLRALAADQPVFGDNISAVLRHCGWKGKDRFVCMSLCLKGRGNTPQNMVDACLMLSSLLGNDCYTVFEDRIIYVFDLTQAGMTREQLLETLLPILRDNLLEAGISTTYDNFHQLHFFFKQAETARTLGVLKNPTYWYFCYEDYQVDDLLDKCLKDTIPDTLIPDGLKALISHDKKKGTEYVELLRIYLESERNIAETIRRAYIHRNTFLYRIGRIEKILDMDLNDPQNRLILELAFAVLDKKKS